MRSPDVTTTTAVPGCICCSGVHTNDDDSSFSGCKHGDGGDSSGTSNHSRTSNNVTTSNVPNHSTTVSLPGRRRRRRRIRRTIDGDSCPRFLQRLVVIVAAATTVIRQKKKRTTRTVVVVVGMLLFLGGLVTTMIYSIFSMPYGFVTIPTPLSNLRQNGRQQQQQSLSLVPSEPIQDHSIQQQQQQQQQQQHVKIGTWDMEPIDYVYYTIRINTWERLDQLQLSIQHHLTCPSVLQIQIVWCIDQSIAIPTWLLQLEQSTEQVPSVTVQDTIHRGDPPPLLLRTKSYPRVVIERHAINSLNERFHALSVIPTAAVLSMDDDVLRPCMALDVAFHKWIRNPDRQVGFDARSHEIVVVDVDTNGLEHKEPPPQQQHHHHHHQQHPSKTTTTTATATRWKYAYMSVTEKTNLYSLTLTRYSFLHRQYLTSYMNDMPIEIRNMVAQNFNCEDIAMSLWISSRTHGRPPLLADYWAVKSQIKMYVQKKISGTVNHKGLRDQCVQSFSTLLQLQNNNFHTVPLHLGTNFEYGATAENWNDPHVPSLSEWPFWHRDTAETVQRWRESNVTMSWTKEWRQVYQDAMQPILDAGFIEKTQPWKDRFHPTKSVNGSTTVTAAAVTRQEQINPHG
jgi:glucuronyl/N-acetylglucosaminyl transferase EXT2